MNIPIRTLFLIDCLCAVLSAVLLGVVLVRLESYIGLPTHVLYPLAGAACLFAMYSGMCYWLHVTNGIYVRIIAASNWVYCLITLGLVVYHYQALTIWGVGYFVGEMVLVAALAAVEWRVGKF